MATSDDSMVPVRKRLMPIWVLTMATLSMCLSGCVTRRMFIRSNPPGATVYVDDYEIGKTPIGHNFTYYGTRRIRLEKDGFETLAVMQKIRTPWYEIPPLDFVSENLVPGELRDTRSLSFDLKPQQIVPPDQLISRAEDLRRGIHFATGTSPPTPPVYTTPPPASQGPTLTAPQGPRRPGPLPSGIGGQTVHPLPPGSGGW